MDNEMTKWTKRVIKRQRRYDKITAVVNFIGIGKLFCKFGQHESWLQLEDNRCVQCTRCGVIRKLY